MLTSATTLLADDDTNRFFGFFFGVAGGIFWLAQLVLFLCALVSILSRRRLTGGGKFLWVVVTFGFPFLGPLGWFLFGRNAQLVRDASSVRM
jgi:hypothetical protein